MNTILGLSAGLVGLILLLLGLFGTFGKKGLGASVRGFFGAIPIGTPKLWAVIALVFGLVLGGFAYGVSGVQALWASTTAGTAAGLSSSSGDNVGTVGALTLADCQITAINAAHQAGDAAPLNITTRADPNDLTHYYIDVKNTTDGGAGIINGTINCNRITNDIRAGQSTTCQFEGGSFRSQTSTSDANTYYIVATSTSKSLVPGYTWQQTAYLKDSAIATATDTKEKVTYNFAQDVTSRTLGFHFVLPGATTIRYLNDQNSVDSKITCGGKTVATITVNKVAN